MTHRVLLSAAFVVLGLRCAGAQGIAGGTGPGRADATPPTISTEAIMRALQPLPRRQPRAQQDQAPAPARREDRWRGLRIGFRLGRSLNRWLGAEFEFHHSGDLRFVSTAVTQITETSTSFQNALSASCCLSSTDAAQSSLNGSAIGTYVNSSTTLT